MKTPMILGAVALGAFVVGAVYLSWDPANHPSAPTQSAPDQAANPDRAMPDAAAQPNSGTPGMTAPPGRTSPAPVPSDPRLQALMVSPDNGLIEFVAGPDGRVIAELDNDPHSPSFKKPLREYMYSRDKVIGLTSYRYYGEQVEMTRTAVSYKPDGTIDQYSESTSTRN